jgi:hypothetical protein
LKKNGNPKVSDHTRHGVEIAEISFAFKNREIINMLKQFGALKLNPKANP